MDSPTKHCPCCQHDLPLTGFSVDRSRPDGLAFYCKRCYAGKRKAARRKHPERQQAYNAQWKRDNAMVVAGYSAAYRDRHPERVKRARWRQDLRKYGISDVEWHEMLVDQLGLCACCGDQLRQPHVDHNHRTNAVRALLCAHCNLMIGQALEDPARLLAGAAYLTDRAG